MTRSSITRSCLSLILGIPVAMTFLAEIFYLVVWGIVLFPAGNLAGKVVWTVTCGIAMGLVIGGLTLLWIEGRYTGRAAAARAAVVFFLVSAYCSWLCSRIDSVFSYFGGEEKGMLFIASGVIPAIFGASLYGWLLYERPGPSSGEAKSA